MEKYQYHASLRPLFNPIPPPPLNPRRAGRLLSSQKNDLAIETRTVTFRKILGFKDTRFWCSRISCIWKNKITRKYTLAVSRDTWINSSSTWHNARFQHNHFLSSTLGSVGKLKYCSRVLFDSQSTFWIFNYRNLKNYCQCFWSIEELFDSRNANSKVLFDEVWTTDTSK